MEDLKVWAHSMVSYLSYLAHWAGNSNEKVKDEVGPEIGQKFAPLAGLNSYFIETFGTLY
jgi:hypothetical protein